MSSGELAVHLDNLGLKAQREVYVRGEVVTYGAGRSLCGLPGITPVFAEEVEIRR